MNSSNDAPPALNFTVKGFPEFIAHLRSNHRCGHWLYRGLKSAKYDLRPTLARYGGDPSDLYAEEMAMIRRTSAGGVEGGDRHSDIARLLLAQHHGARTRLQDWTSSALVAAYFAADSPTESEKDEDFKIVAAHVCPEGPAYTHHTLGDLKAFDFYEGYFKNDGTLHYPGHQRLLKDVLDEHGVIFMEGADVSPNVAAQQGYVSIQRDIDKPLDEHVASSMTQVTHITVPAEARHDFQEGVYQLGLRHRMIFPSVDSLFGAYEKDRLIHERMCSKCGEGDES